MRYKILLTGNNKTIIDDFFAKAGEDFEYQSTSARYEDILSHIKYFRPNGFLYCLNHEMPDSFRRISELKQAPESADTAFFIIGTRGDCDAYSRTAPGAADMVMEKPMSTGNMEERMRAYFSSLPETGAVHSDEADGQTGKISQTAQPLAEKVPQAAAQPLAGKAPQAVQSPAGKAPQAAAQPLAGKAPQAAAQPLAGKAPQAAAQSTASQPVPAAAQPQAAVSQPQKNISVPGTEMAQENKPQQPAAASASVSAAAEDPNAALLSALSAQVSEAAKVLDSVADLDLDLNLEPVEGVEGVTVGTAGRKHILVVDDDSRMLKIIQRHLADKYDVATALNGKIAFKFLENRKTDLILLDYEMPLESGPTVLKRLRENPLTRNIPVIFLTGISDRNRIEKALALKPQGYLLKPIDHIKLLSTISKFID